MINWLKKFFETPTERYLAQSADMYDLENRLKELRRKGIWV